MLEIHKRSAADTMGVQNGDGLRPAQAGSIRRGWQASKRHRGKQETRRQGRNTEASKRRRGQQETWRKARDMEKKKRIHLELRGQ